MKPMSQKFLVSIIALLILYSGATGQENSYRSGKVKLVLDPAYGQGIDWQTLLSDQKGYIHPARSFADDLHLAVTPDGVLFVANIADFMIYQLDAAGNLLRKIQNPKTIPADSSASNRRPGSLAIWDNRQLLVCEYQGRIGQFDLQGNRGELLEYDYGLHAVIPLTPNRVALLGSVVVKDGIKYRVALQEFPRGKEREIFSVRWDMRRNVLMAKNKDGLISTTTPFSQPRVFVRPLPGGEFLLGEWHGAEVWFVSLEGSRRLAFKLGVPPPAFPQEKKDSYVASLEKQAEKNPDIGRQLLDDLKTKPDFFPVNLPYYSEMLVDGEGNILLFDFREDQQIGFSVYSAQGAKIGHCLLDSGDILLPQGVNQRRFVILGRDVYLVAATKAAPALIRPLKARWQADQ